MTQPKLAIAIPTFNRAALLDEILWNIGPQLERHAEKCVGYVIDNASTDDTPEVVRQHQARWKNLRYHCNDANVGLVRNIARAITLPNERWVWLLGDDDLPMPYAIEALLKDLDMLDEERVTFLLLKGAKLDEDRRFFPPSWDSLTPVDPPVQVYENGTEIIGIGGIHYLAWLSSLVVNRSRWDQALFDQLYRETDLYTFVAVLLRTSFEQHCAFSRRLFVMATDRGSRAYYFSKTAIARLAEFPEIEQFVLERFGRTRARILLKHDRLHWMRNRLACALKLAVFSDEYRDQQDLLEHPRSPFLVERVGIRLVTRLARIGAVRALLTRIYQRKRADRVFTRESINRSA